MTCCNIIEIRREDEPTCQCVFRCAEEVGARVLGAPVTLDAAPTGPADFIPGTPVFTEDGVEYKVVTIASLSAATSIGFGIVSCGAPVTSSTTFPLTFQPEIVTHGEYWTDYVAYPDGFESEAAKRALHATFRANRLSGVKFYA